MHQTWDLYHQTWDLPLHPVVANEDLKTLPETNSKFAPENGCLEDKPFLLGPGLFSGAFAVSFREGRLGFPTKNAS